jgi:signal transduction histidine kinase
MRTTSEYTLIVFAFFQMAAMFRGAMREFAAAKEIEQLSRMEAETQRRLNTLKSEYLGELSHELRMPISAISGFAQLFQDVLDDETFDRADLLSSARWVESEAERMDRLVSQLLDMTAIEAGRFTLKKEDVSVAELFERIRHIYFPMFNGARNRLIINLEADQRIHADRERVLQVLVNLVSNACKYTEDGEITLAAAEENGTVRFSVTDTGTGMEQGILSVLFTRYPQMRGGVKGVTGNGLGLFISKKITEAHGGGIGAESESGKGTMVWFTIPQSGGYEG